MIDSYVNNLVFNVIKNSEADTWDLAVYEWELADCEEDELCEASCICGKEHIRYLHKIVNRENGNILFPIGSSCIKKFNRSDLNQDVKIKEDLFKLLHHLENRDYIELSSEFFTRKLIKYLYDEGAFDNSYNGFDGYYDYEFFLKMFNKRDKLTITHNQQKKINAIIIKSLFPYLRKQLSNKIH